MSYMLSVSLNIPNVELEGVGQLLAAIRAHGGQIEDVSMRFIPEYQAMDKAAQQSQVRLANGQVLALVPIPSAAGAENKTRRVRKSDESKPAGATTPAPQPQVGDNSGSDDAEASLSGAVPTAVGVTVGANEGAALPVGAVLDTSTEAAPSSNVIDVAVVRAWCAQAVQADGSRRLVLTKLLAEFGSTSISAVPEDKRAEFYERVQKEFQ